MRYRAQLDWLNFFLADVRGGLGPYVGVFLLTQAHWDQATIGAVLTVSGLIGIALHVPIGALIDATRFKRGLLVGGVAALTGSALAIARAPTLPVVLAADIVMAVLGAVFAPTVAAITLGLIGRAALAERLGRNAACDRAGNIFIGAVAGLVGWAFGQRAVFHLMPLLRSSRPSRCWRSRPAPSITSRRAASTSTVLAARGAPPDGTCCSIAGRCWCWLPALLCFTSPTRPRWRC
jgi:predicted MFS family arabinose efflux permease